MKKDLNKLRKCMNNKFSRNYIFISDQLQDKIESTKILIAGCGMGSQIAITLARLGFQNFILIDGDSFDESNINRQHCFECDLGKNKAKVTKDYILKINNKAKIKVINKNIKNFNEIKKESFDIVINTIDLDSLFFVELNEYCVKNNKLEIFPLNIGFIGYVLLYNIEIKKIITDYKQEILSKIFKDLNDMEYNQKFEEYLSRDIEYDPQNVIATLQNSSIISKIILDYLSNKQLRYFPEYYTATH